MKTTLMKTVKRFRFFIISLLAIGVLYFIDKNMGITAIKTTAISFKEMIMIVPPIFILLGLLDVWVPREIMVKYLGEGSGVKGVIIAIFLGSMTAGPLYGAFPLVAVLMKKGAKLFNMLILLGAWSTTKIPMLLFEFSTLGTKFALTRLLVDIPGIIILAFVASKLLKDKDKKKISDNITKIQ